METLNVQDSINNPDVQINSPATLVYKGDQVIVENERYISSKKCEFDGNTSINDEVFCQSSCNDIIHNEESFELIKNEEKSPKITNTTTLDNRNSTELKDEKMEKYSCTTEPQLNNIHSENGPKDKSITNVENSMINTQKDLSKKKNKKLLKIQKHKKIYLKFKEKLNKKSKLDKGVTKKELPIHDVSKNSISINHEKEKVNNENMEITPMNSVNKQTSESVIQNDISFEENSLKNTPKPSENKNFSDIVEMTPICNEDVREVTLITADGDTVFIPTKKRAESLPHFNADQNKMLIQSDSTVFPPKINLKNEKQKKNSSMSKNDINSDENIDNNIVASGETINNNIISYDENGTPYYDIENSKIIITTIEEKIVKDDDGKDKIIKTITEEHMIVELEENKDKAADTEYPIKKKDSSYVDLSDHKKNKEVTSDPSIQENNKNMIGDSISMVKPFHLDNETSTQLIEENTRNIDLPLINENVDSTSSEKNLLTVPSQKGISSANITNDSIEKRKSSDKKKPLKSSLKKGVYAIKYFRKPKEEVIIPQYVIVEDFEKFKENTERCINENSRNLEANTITMNENNEKFKDTVKEGFNEIKSNLVNLNNDYVAENEKLKEEIVFLKNCNEFLKEERKREMEQLRNEVAEEIIKIQNNIKNLEVEKDKEIKQLRDEIRNLHQKEENYKEVIEQHILGINTSLVKLKKENMKMKDESTMNIIDICNDIQKIKENKIMEINVDRLAKQDEIEKINDEIQKMKNNKIMNTNPDHLVKQSEIEKINNEIRKIKNIKIMNTNPDHLVKQNEIETISKQIIKSNVQWNELSHNVQSIPIQIKKDIDDKFETFEKDQEEKSQQIEIFISETKTNQSKLLKCVNELFRLHKVNESGIENQAKSINEAILNHEQLLQDFENTQDQIDTQNERIDAIGDRVDRYCTNDYLDTVIELEDLRKITNRTTEELFSLQKLNLYCKNLDRLPKRIFSLENLNELWLGRNNLNNINDKIGDLKNLKRLSVADNNLSQLPIGIKNLKNLTHLYLYKNKLRELPPEIGELENLIHLDVESNKLIKLPEELKKLTKLENLDIENNQFSEFPKIIFELKNLIKLNLSNNKFFFIPRELENLVHLKQLNLRNNYLRSFPYSILKFTNLEELDLSNNLFKDIPSEIRYLNKLKNLNLANVRIDEIVPEFRYLKDLKTLNLSNCNIKILPNCLKELQNLEEIYLVNNDAIVVLPEYFKNFKNLKRLFLNRNAVYKNGMEYPRYQGTVYNELLKKNIIRTE
ncbi:hypothetical protein BCR36DRAFT_370403 [Piromyces finnis]|uniref:Disease resistance R13L4/SHOC-2-like LRR domain-containing protein n=1 Tax=Piromyces finnis TaxID=1754191 RepID=A0A1Y1VAM4_9FUNG|nr:hypothetical protein BCR36DRAFT_370403 [Piromyces finnis]|eukprot:ORX50375.1 hypothetical protein BCR36DRAFT_370403 [Piromyces finnis]